MLLTLLLMRFLKNNLFIHKRYLKMNNSAVLFTNQLKSIFMV